MERDPEKERQKLRKNITEKRWQMGGLNKQGEEKNRVPDTAHDCPILRIGVACEKPAPEIWKTLQRGVFQLSYAAFPHTTKPPSSAAFYSGRCRRGHGDPILTVGGR